jgi:nucleotide-binding universal stress UspA family protein
MKINKVLVPVDFSPPSILAVNSGVALARALKAKLCLLHVVTPLPGELYTHAEADRFETQRREWADNTLPTLVAPEDQDDLDVRFVVRTGEVKDIVESFVRDGEADVVIMGTHGRGLFARFFLGSVTHVLLRRLGVPVLTVCHASRPLEFKRILFATDLGFDSFKAFRFSLDLAAATHSTLILAHVIDAKPIVSYEVPGRAETTEEAGKFAAQYALEKFAEYQAEAQALHVDVECVLGEGKASESLRRIADDDDVDLIVLGLRKKGVLERAVLGSTAEHLIRATHVPVLSVPIDTPVTIVEDEPGVAAGQIATDEAI